MNWQSRLIAAVSLASLLVAGVPAAWAEDKDVAAPAIALPDPPQGQVLVQIFEGVPEGNLFQPTEKPAVEFTTPAMALVDLPRKYTSSGVIGDWRQPLLVRCITRIRKPEGENNLILRAKDSARLLVDGRVVAQTSPLSKSAGGHEPVPEIRRTSTRRPVLPPHQERITRVAFDNAESVICVEVVVGSQKLRPELGELTVSLDKIGAPAKLVSPAFDVPLTDEAIERYAAEQLAWLRQFNTERRRAAVAKQADYWRRRHELARAEVAQRAAIEMPDVSNADVLKNPIDRFIAVKLSTAKLEPARLTDDEEFLRRATLDTVGVIPTADEIALFRGDESSQRRDRVIDRLLADPRWADHWVSYWQDVLAENPNVLKGKLNNTGPFRWWIYESLLDNKSIDRFATELVMMEGSTWYGGPAGFGIATDNDAPLADKAHVISKALLAVEMKCARCHDAPFHHVSQHDTFSLAAMLARDSQKIPATSVVPTVEGARRPEVKISLQPGQSIAPEWPLAVLAGAELPAEVLRDPNDSRERVAAIITSPVSDRFPQVIVNRLWARLLGRGLVEPVDDWENATPSHPELLEWLARELMTHDYDVKHIARLIMSSPTYQRRVSGEASRESRALFASPTRRRMTAEQLVDSLLLAAGKEMHAEPLCLDPEGRRPVVDFLNLGTPRRAWELTSLSNERDRPALALPMAQNLIDLLMTFGWRDARQNPITVREEEATVLQPAALANGIVGRRITTLSEDSRLTELAIEDRSPAELVDAVFDRVLSRRPTEAQRERFVEFVREGYDERRTGAARPAPKPAVYSAVSWSNHLSPEATRIKLELEQAAREGEAPTVRLTTEWRERMEDMVWALVNSPEFVFVP